MISRNAFACAVALFAGQLRCFVTRAADHPPATVPQTDWKIGSHHLTVDGRDRTFLLDVPRGLKPGSPLVMVFRGFTVSAPARQLHHGSTARDATEALLYVFDAGGPRWPRTLAANGEPTADTLGRFYEAHVPKTP